MRDEKIFLYHYYRKDHLPFQSITKLPKEQALELAKQLKELSGKAFRRFSQPELYLELRYNTEQWLKEQLIKQGGKPKCEQPYYFCVGESSLFQNEGYEGFYSVVIIPLEEINESEISFTFPDSMASRFMENEKDAVYYHPEYHGKVFTKAGIISIIKKYGLPGDVWRYDPKRKYDYFIEAQVWNDKYFSKYKK